MSDLTVHVLAERVQNLTERVKAVESDLKATMATQRWHIGAAVGAGSVSTLALTLLLPALSKALGLPG